MEELQRKHRQEQKDLQNQIMQKKKSATKKTRKGVNDECATLERTLMEKHQNDLALFNARVQPSETDQAVSNVDDTALPTVSQDDLNGSFASLTVDNGVSNVAATKKPNRQKARRARRAAEQEAAAAQAAVEANDIPNLRLRELEDMKEQFSSKNLQEYEIRSDGHCLYAAVADQLIANGIDSPPSPTGADLSQDLSAQKPTYKTTRQIAASYITANADDFTPFLEEPLKDYVRTIRETGEWGGHLELMALAKAYNVKINVLHANGQVDIIGDDAKINAKSLWLAYYRHSFGLGEHYNSLRQLPTNT